MNWPPPRSNKQSRVVPSGKPETGSNKLSTASSLYQGFERLKPTLKLGLESINSVGSFLLGDLWKTFCLSVQDALAVGLVLLLPRLIGSILQYGEFERISDCHTLDIDSPRTLACYVIVSSGFLAWILIAGRFLGRFIKDFRALLPRQGGNL